MSILAQTHGNFVYPRRVHQLARNIAELLPQGAEVLDVGCGDGALSSEVAKLRPDIRITGIDILIRPKTRIPVMKFDGQNIPFPDCSFDVVMFVDVLHHTFDPILLLREAKRVSRRALLIKDHSCNGPFASVRLRFMDWVGNSRHGVVLPYNYWPQQKWSDNLKELKLEVESWRNDLELYPWWANWLFGRSLQFVTSVRLS